MGRGSWLGWMVVVAAGCASPLRPCVSALDCGAGAICSESFVCQPASTANAPVCAPADSVGGLRMLRVTGAAMRGDVGPFRGVNGSACDTAAFRDGNNIFVNTVVPSNHGPTMAIIGVHGGLSRGDLAPGRTVTFYGDRDVTVNTCALWNQEDWAFDHQSQQVTVTVTRLASGENSYAYEALFPAGNDPAYGEYPAQTVRGSFVMTP